MIEARDLWVRFNAGLPTEITPLQGLTITIPPGEFVCVIGSNGAGKSTLLNTLAGDVWPVGGRIVIDGTDVTSLPAHRRSGLVARVFQDPLVGTCEQLTVEENLALASRRGRRRSLRPALGGGIRDQFRSALAELGLGLEHKLRDPLSLLSGGQRQVVSLLMASLAPAKLLLLDEHTSALDPKTAAFVVAMSQRLTEEGRMAVLMVTHSMQQALDVGHRTVMLHQGKVAFDVGGAERSSLGVADLLARFEKNVGQPLSSDSLVLG